MKLAVKFYKDVDYKDDDQHSGIPGYWPAEVMELDDSAVIQEPWVTMSVDGYKQYRGQFQADYDAWEAKKNASFIKKYFGWLWPK